MTDVIGTSKPERPRVFIERIGGYATICLPYFGPKFGNMSNFAGGLNIGTRILPSTFGQLNPEQVIARQSRTCRRYSADWEAYVPGGHWIPLGTSARMRR